MTLIYSLSPVLISHLLFLPRELHLANITENLTEGGSGAESQDALFALQIPNSIIATL